MFSAIPQNAINTSTLRQPVQEVSKAPPPTRVEPSVFTFQTTAPQSSNPSTNYSSIIRPNNAPISQRSVPKNDNNNNIISQPSSRPQPTTVYDSFQHNVPSHQPEQRSSPPPIPARAKNGNVTHVIPGKLYNLADDPLYLFYDRQYPTQPNATSSQFQSFPIPTTFQPSSNVRTPQNPPTTTYTNAPERIPQQSAPITTDSNPENMHPFDLSSLIRNVQQDYLREIQPFVSSAKFVQKDHEYGQNLGDVGFVTPVTVRKGFTGQANDILRRSFGRVNQPNQQPANRPNPTKYDDEDDDDDIAPIKRRPPLDIVDSKQSITSVTSVSPYSSDYDEEDDFDDEMDYGPKKIYHNQATSPPRKIMNI